MGREEAAAFWVSVLPCHFCLAGAGTGGSPGGYLTGEPHGIGEGKGEEQA